MEDLEDPVLPGVPTRPDTGRRGGGGRHSSGSPANDRRGGSSRGVVAAGAVCVLLVVLAFVVYAFASYSRISGKMQPPTSERAKIETALVPQKPKNPFTYILMLGQDRRPGEKQTRTDTIVLARLDSRDRSIVMVSIPRDTRTEVPGHGLTKINAASAYGGIQLTIDTVKRFTGLPVNHYVQIDFPGFQRIVDELGGVDMFVSAPVNYGQGNVVDRGQQHLNGLQALEVMRNRHAYGDGDFARMQNQQLFLKAIARKMMQSGSLARVPGVLVDAADYIQTDMDFAEIASMVKDYRTDSGDKLHSYTVPAMPKMIGRVSYVIPDEKRTKALFDEIRKGGTPSAGLGYRMGID